MTPINLVYRHSLFFGENWTDELEKKAEKSEDFVTKLLGNIEETCITMEEGKPVEMSFVTKERLIRFTHRIVQVTQPDCYTFNTPESYTI
jgi:hypothetical protein